jgi:hypothetical protein
MLARAAASAAGKKARQAPFEPSTGSGRGLSWAIGATVIACSIGAPVWAWWSVRRPRAPAAISVTAPLVSGAAPAAVAPLPESACAPLAPVQAGGQSSPPAVAMAAPDPSSDRAAAAMADPPAPPSADPPVPVQLAPHAEFAAAPAAGPAAPSPAAQFAESGAVGDDGQGEPAAPSDGVAPLPEGEGLDPGLAPADAGVVDPQDVLDVTLPRLAAPTLGPERGTNGALIFD